MKLSEIIRNCGVLSIQGRQDVEITSLTNDSRRVQPGSLFIAVNGCGNDGRQYIDKALENGAAAILYERMASAVLPDGEGSAAAGFVAPNPVPAPAGSEDGRRAAGTPGRLPSARPPGKPRKLTWKEQRELEALEAELPQLEAEKAELEAKMSSGTLPYAELQAASERIQALINEISQREERWLELSD